MTSAHAASFATLLPSGSVLVIDDNGSTTTDYFESPVEIFAGSFTPYPPSLRFGRSNETVTLLPNGKVRVAGGISPAASLLTSGTEEFSSTEIISP